MENQSDNNEIIIIVVVVILVLCCLSIFCLSSFSSLIGTSATYVSTQKSTSENVKNAKYSNIKGFQLGGPSSCDFAKQTCKNYGGKIATKPQLDSWYKRGGSYCANAYGADCYRYLVSQGKDPSNCGEKGTNRSNTYFGTSDRADQKLNFVLCDIPDASTHGTKPNIKGINLNELSSCQIAKNKCKSEGGELAARSQIADWWRKGGKYCAYSYGSDCHGYLVSQGDDVTNCGVKGINRSKTYFGTSDRSNQKLKYALCNFNEQK